MNDDGSRKSYEQLRNERRAADHAKKVETRNQPKPPVVERPAPLSYNERKAIREAEHLGKQIAADQAAKAAKAAAVPQNPYTSRMRELQDRTWEGPQIRRRLERVTSLAEKWDSDRAAEQEAAALAAKISADPLVKTSRDYSAAMVKTAPEWARQEASKIAGIADAGDSKLAWERIRDLESRIWHQADIDAEAKRVSKSVTDAEFQAAAVKAEDAKARFEHAATMAPEATDAE